MFLPPFPLPSPYSVGLQIQAHFIHWIEIFDRFDEILAAHIEEKSYSEEHVLSILTQTELILRELVFHPKYYNSIDVSSLLPVGTSARD